MTGKQLLPLAGYAAGGLLALVLLPLILPVVLGVLAAALLDPWIRRLQRRTGMGRCWAAALCVSLALAGTAGLLWALGSLLLGELQRLSGQLPALLGQLGEYAAALGRSLERLGQRLPDGLGDALSAWGESLLSGGGALAGSLYERVFSLASRLLSALPGALFFLLTMVLSCYFAAGELPRLQDLAMLHLPGRLRRRLGPMAHSLRGALGGWLRAQLGLMGVTFLVLLLGFLLLRVRSPLLLALGVAVLDALPVFGTGTVLIPWALAAGLSGDMGLGLGLAGLYGAAVLLRNILEPRLLGAQLGMSPLMTLAAVYGGWRLGGFWGMVLLPIGVVTGVCLYQSARRPAPAQEKAPAPSGQVFSISSAEK